MAVRTTQQITKWFESVEKEIATLARYLIRRGDWEAAESLPKVGGILQRIVNLSKELGDAVDRLPEPTLLEVAAILDRVEHDQLVQPTFIRESTPKVEPKQQKSFRMRHASKEERAAILSIFQTEGIDTPLETVKRLLAERYNFTDVNGRSIHGVRSTLKLNRPREKS